MKRKIPKERIGDLPFGGRDLTGDYVSATRKEFRECLRKILLEIAISAYNRKSTDIASMTEQALECRKHYFQGMKGATNITEEAIKELVVRESELQSRFYARLAELKEHFKQFTSQWTKFAIYPPSTFEGPSRWDTELTVGCHITVGSTELLAFPLVQATTATYYDDVLFIDEDCVIILDYRPKAVEPFQHVGMWCQEFAVSGAASIRSVKEDFPLAKEATIYNKFLLLDSEEPFAHKQLGDLRSKYGVIAILKVDPKNHKAFIYTGREDYPLHIQLELLYEVLKTS